MADTFKYVFLSLVRNKGILIWALAFPIVLSCCFMVMFQGLDQLAQTEPTRVVVVQDEAYDDSDAFRQFVDAASEGDDALLSATFADTPEEAKRLVNESANEDRPYAGYVTVGMDGMPTVHLLPEDGSASSGVNNVYQAILVRVMDVFCSKSHMIRELLAKDPLFLADPSNVESVFQVSDVTQKTSLTENAPRESVRYYFALLGMAAMFAAQGSLLAVGALLPNASPLGARRALGGISRIRALLGCILASWLVSFGCLAIAYLFIRYAAGVDFGNRDLPCLGVLAVSSLMSVGMGALIGSIPKGSNRREGGDTCRDSLLRQPVCRPLRGTHHESGGQRGRSLPGVPVHKPCGADIPGHVLPHVLRKPGAVPAARLGAACDDSGLLPRVGALPRKAKVCKSLNVH